MPDDPDPNNPDPNPAPPEANQPPPAKALTPAQTPGLDQLPPKGASPSDGLLARARATGLSRDILAWRDARG